MLRHLTDDPVRALTLAWRALPAPVRSWVKLAGPILVLTCGSMPATRWASAISWVLIVYPALVDGSASVTR